MAAPRIVLSSNPAPRKRNRAFDALPDEGWRMLNMIGGAFALIGALDLALAWLPMGLGNPEWEFGTISATLNGLPLPSLGLLLMLASGLAMGRRVQVRALAILLATLVAVMLATGILYVTVVPLAFASTDDLMVRSGLQKAVIKAAALLVIYPALYAWLAFRGWRATSARA